MYDVHAGEPKLAGYETQCPSGACISEYIHQYFGKMNSALDTYTFFPT